jgi:hypothetical protein
MARLGEDVLGRVYSLRSSERCVWRSATGSSTG